MLLASGSAYVALLYGDGQPLSLHLSLASLCQLLILALGLHVRHQHLQPGQASQGARQPPAIVGAHGPALCGPCMYSPPTRNPTAGGTLLSAHPKELISVPYCHVRQQEGQAAF